MGLNITERHIAIAKVLELGVSKAFQAFVPPEVGKVYFEKYEEGIRFVIDRPNIKHLNAVVATPITRAYYTQDHERLEQFMRVFKTAEPLSKEDWGATKLKRYITDMDSPGTLSCSKGNADKLKYLYGVTETSLKAFLSHKPIRRLEPSDVELFPLPERID